MKKNKQKGVTLIESMISLGVFSVILLVSGQLLVSTQKISSSITTQSEMREENRKLDNLLTYELRKAIYFYPKPTNPTNYKFIPKAVQLDSNALRVKPVNMPEYNSTSQDVGNIVTFFSIDKTLNVSDIPTISDYVHKGFTTEVSSTLLSSLTPLVSNTTSNTSLTGLGLIDQFAKNTKVQLLDLNCIYLRKNPEKNNIELVLYKQKGFFNDSKAGHLERFTNQIVASGPLLAPLKTLDETTSLIKDSVIDKVRAYLDNKNYTGLEISNKPFIETDGVFVPPSLDFTDNGSNLNWSKNGSYTVIAKNIGIKTNNTSITYTGNQPTESNRISTQYKTNIDFKNNSNNSNIINNNLSNSDIGFQAVYERNRNLIKIMLNTAKLSNDQRKAYYNYNEYEINPKISSK